MNLNSQHLYSLLTETDRAPHVEVLDGSLASPGPFLLEVKLQHRGGRGRWWRPNNAGYTSQLDRAGIYTSSSAPVRSYLLDAEAVRYDLVDARVLLGPTLRMAAMVLEHLGLTVDKAALGVVLRDHEDIHGAGEALDAPLKVLLGGGMLPRASMSFHIKWPPRKLDLPGRTVRLLRPMRTRGKLGVFPPGLLFTVVGVTAGAVRLNSQACGACLLAHTISLPHRAGEAIEGFELVAEELTAAERADTMRLPSTAASLDANTNTGAPE